MGMNRPVKLLVLGDVMLDRYRHGIAERVSAEAPTLVMRIDEEMAQPGGAARVALYARRLGAEVHLAGAVGRDNEAAVLFGQFEEEGIGCEWIVVSPDRPTTVKERILGRNGVGRFQMLRLDREARNPLPVEAAALLRLWAERAVADCDAVLIADHGKGVCEPAFLTAVLRAASAADVPVLVDPASGASLCRYQGAETLFPNRAEAAMVLGRTIVTAEDGLAAAHELTERSGAKSVVLKLDREGVALAVRGETPRLFASRAEHVRDVTGAGDMILAAAGIARAGGADWFEAARLANIAAGLKVERDACESVDAEELRFAQAASLGTSRKLITVKRMELLAEHYRRRGRSVVLTNGCFDLLHTGHAFCLEHAARLGEVLVVAINSDASVRRLKGLTRPVVPEDERAALVAALGCVAHVLIYDEDTPHEVLKRVRPDVLVKGGDYAPGEVVGHEVVEGYGGKVALTPLREGRSTTHLIHAVVQRTLFVEAA